MQNHPIKVAFETFWVKNLWKTVGVFDKTTVTKFSRVFHPKKLTVFRNCWKYLIWIFMAKSCQKNRWFDFHTKLGKNYKCWFLAWKFKYFSLVVWTSAHNTVKWDLFSAISRHLSITSISAKVSVNYIYRIFLPWEYPIILRDSSLGFLFLMFVVFCFTTAKN